MSHANAQSSHRRLLLRKSVSISEEMTPELRNGASTYGSVFADDLTGKTVLHVGAGDGQLCWEAARRGADRVIGVEICPERVARARAQAARLGLPVEFMQLDVDEDFPEGSFDYVLCMTAMDQVRNPLLLLERLITRTRERLVLDVPGVRLHDRKAGRFSRSRRFLLRRLPIIYLNRRPLSSDRRRLYFSLEAVKCLLLDHRRVFSKVDVLRSPAEGRHIVVAHRRRIGRLVVIAGPTSSGKSTLISELAAGGAREVAERLGIDDHRVWESLGVDQFAKDRRTDVANVILHYDFLTRLKRQVQESQMLEFLDIVRSARDVTFLTLWTEPDRLREQFEENEIAAYVRRHKAHPRNSKTLRLREEYRDARRIVDYYSRWFEFASTLGANHVVVSRLPETRFLTIDEWQGEHGQLPIHPGTAGETSP